ncbi:MAG TPA: EAL domain-containing protein [Egibacteraceae bacterium]|nr:EAL domain-containing protein [Egibacteraceae bacterium]
MSFASIEEALKGASARAQAPDAAPEPKGFSRAKHLDRILSKRAITPVFQPLVDLRTHQVIAYEALSRGPAGSPLQRPDLLFQAARELGRVNELDWACRAAALEAALEGKLGQGVTLFMNVEPDVLGSPVPDELQFVQRMAERSLRVILEVTERALTVRPAELLRALEWARERWWGVALDDVGANPDSLALMPFVKPDVIKLDFRFLHEQPNDEMRRIMDVVHAESARTGAVILAEGIETEENLQQAISLGATMGQGWYFGRPEALPERIERPLHAVPMRKVPPASALPTPFEMLGLDVALQRGTRAEVEQHSAALKLQAAELIDPPPVVLGAIQSGSRFAGPLAERYENLGRTAAFVGVAGTDMPRSPAPGVRGVALRPNDPLSQQWVMVVISPTFHGAVVARGAGERSADGHDMFDYVVTHERDVVVSLADTLMRRMGMVPD